MRTLRPLLYVERNLVAFIQGLEPRCIDSCMMNKYIRTIFLLNEAVTFTVIEPFHNTLSHSDTLLSA